MSTRDPMDDEQFLNWIADHLVHQYGDSENYDHIRRLRTMAIAAREPGIPAPTGFEASWKNMETVPAGTRVRYVGDNGRKTNPRDPDIGDLGTVLEDDSVPFVSWDRARDTFGCAAGLCNAGHGRAVCGRELQIVQESS